MARITGPVTCGALVNTSLGAVAEVIQHRVPTLFRLVATLLLELA